MAFRVVVVAIGKTEGANGEGADLMVIRPSVGVLPVLDVSLIQSSSMPSPLRSPAATASLAIGETVAERALSALDLERR